jgi:Fe-S-cluster containining protein
LAKPVKFECQSNCGKCCTGSGYVYLNLDDLNRLASKLQWSPLTFRLKFCEETNGLLHLKIENNKCPFLINGWQCGVQSFKPTQCRTFPFWPGVDMETVGEWCPGVGVGKEYSEEEIKELETETAAVVPGFQLVSR